jgi:ATP-dependent Clp protease ATP-binding subunit ClpB
MRSKRIVDIQLDGLRRRLEERHIKLELTDAAKELVPSQGFDPINGARPLRRTIQKEIVQPLAVRLLSGDFADGDTIQNQRARWRAQFRAQPHWCGGRRGWVVRCS